MVGGLRAVGGGDGLVLLGVSDEIVNVVEALVVRAHKDERGLGHMVADGGEVRGGVGAEFLYDG